jgi:hypothetical protein
MMKRIAVPLAALACLTFAAPTIASARDWMHRGGWHYRTHRGVNGRVPGDVMAPDRTRNPIGDVMAPDRTRRPGGGGDVMAPSR